MIVHEVYNTENFVLSRFLRSGTNGQTRGKLFFISFAGGCFSKVATYSKSYWKRCYLEAMFINWAKCQSKERQVSKNYYGAALMESITK